jgi:hypothetical protein
MVNETEGFSTLLVQAIANELIKTHMLIKTCGKCGDRIENQKKALLTTLWDAISDYTNHEVDFDRGDDLEIIIRINGKTREHFGQDDFDTVLEGTEMHPNPKDKD